jgi:hypothetical protein
MGDVSFRKYVDAAHDSGTGTIHPSAGAAKQVVNIMNGQDRVRGLKLQQQE